MYQNEISTCLSTCEVFYTVVEFHDHNRHFESNTIYVIITIAFEHCIINFLLILNLTGEVLRIELELAFISFEYLVEICV